MSGIEKLSETGGMTGFFSAQCFVEAVPGSSNFGAENRLTVVTTVRRQCLSCCEETADTCRRL